MDSSKTNNILISYLKDLNFSQNLKFKQNDIDSLLINLIKEKEEEKERDKEIERNRDREIDRERNTLKFKLIKLIKFIKIYNTRSLISSILSVPPSEFEQILQLTKELTNKNNSKLYFVYLPHYNRYKKNFDSKNYNLVKVKNIVTKLKIPFIDIHKEVFEKEQNPLKLFPFELYGHYNVYGYKKVAETIYKFSKD